MHAGPSFTREVAREGGPRRLPGVTRLDRAQDGAMLADRALERPAQDEGAHAVAAHVADELAVHLLERAVAGCGHDQLVEGRVRLEERLHGPKLRPAGLAPPRAP